MEIIITNDIIRLSNKERNDNMKLYYDNILLGYIFTLPNLTVDEALNCLGIDMDVFASERGWDDWDYECLRLEVE